MSNTKQRILFRADGNVEIGLGHVYRCLAIAERLCHKFDCYFVSHNPSVQLTEAVSKFSKLIVIDGYKNRADEALALVTIINKYLPKIVILDGYYFDTIYQETIKKSCDIKLISIDDDQPFHYASDVVINHSAGLSINKLSVDPHTKVWLGYNYFLLRKQFIELLKKKKTINTVQSVLICFGGADLSDHTGTITQYIKNIQFINKLTIVLGSSYIHIDKLKENIADSETIELKVNVDADCLAELMYKTDIAIVPASTIALEAFTAKMIIITGTTANNQQNIYNGLIKEANVFGIDSFNHLTYDKLLDIIQNISTNFNNCTINAPINISDQLIAAIENIDNN